MNQRLSPKTHKRVPGQYHLTLHRQSIFNGLPILSHPDGFVSEYLDRLYCTINRALQRYTRVFAVRVDLHFPQYYSSLGQDTFSNECLNSFIKSLKYQLEKYSANKKRLRLRVHDVSFEYVWARERDSNNDKPHFHLLLLFSGHAFNTLGCFSSDRESLYNRIGASWADALGFHVAEGVKFVHFPSDGQYSLELGNLEQLAQLFCRASYLTKVATKNFHDGYHVFGGSRV